MQEQIDAKNEGVVIPPFSMRWMKSKRGIEEHYQWGTLPAGMASVVLKVPGKVVGQKLTEEIWVMGHKFKAQPFVPNRADTLCGICSHWEHSEFRYPRIVAVCTVCSGNHRTESHKCDVAMCGAIGRICPHTAMKCPNCNGSHPARDARCQAKMNAIAVARGMRQGTRQPEVRSESIERNQLRHCVPTP